MCCVGCGDGERLETRSKVHKTYNTAAAVVSVKYHNVVNYNEG